MIAKIVRMDTMFIARMPGLLLNEGAIRERVERREDQRLGPGAPA